MNYFAKILLLILLLTVTYFSFAQEQQKVKTPEEMVVDETNRLERLLKLEPHQTFYVDSILQHDMIAMYKEIDKMKEAGTQEFTVYKQIQEKWLDTIEAAYKKVFTEDQWTEYLRMHGKLKKESKKKKPRTK